MMSLLVMVVVGLVGSSSAATTTYTCSSMKDYQQMIMEVGDTVILQTSGSPMDINLECSYIVFCNGGLTTKYSVDCTLDLPNSSAGDELNYDQTDTGAYTSYNSTGTINRTPETGMALFDFYSDSTVNTGNGMKCVLNCYDTDC